MRKSVYYFIVFLLLIPITASAAANNSVTRGIEISYINVTLDGKNINSGVVEVTPGQQLQLHVEFNYYGGKIIDYPATQLKLDDGKYNGVVQVSNNHFEKISDTQAAEDVTLSISSTAKIGDTIPVKFIIIGPDINSEEGETITFVIKKESTSPTDSSSDSSSSSSSTSQTDSSSDSSSSSSSTSQTDSSSDSSSSSSSTSQTDSSSDSSSSSSSTSQTDTSSDSSSSSSSTSQTDSSSDSSSSSSSTNQTDSSSDSSSNSSDSTGSKDSSPGKQSENNTEETTSGVTSHLQESSGKNLKDVTLKKKIVSSAKNSETSDLTKNEPLKTNRLLPQTGMDSSSMIWLGLGLVNMITAIYLLRKK
ncbi:hypothetical protein CF160_07640 [Enterococcus pseudoavium]|nr:hypothetical protein CF160_07640 [Enterococcus pseudoavium]